MLRQAVLVSLVLGAVAVIAVGAPPPAGQRTHWAFVAPSQPELPAVKNNGWPRSPIDHFVLAKLEAAGLTPAPQADRYQLVRRLYLDLVGLPPVPAEVDAFVHDSSPDAYEKLVDTLLGREAYGERWARLWLDLARYADTKGYEKDLRRPGVWRYRDWVIGAFNADMSYDRFTAEQLAGDLLPNATPDQILATAFHRLTPSNDEGGTDDEEFRTIAVKDRVDTTMQVWMGLTMGCAMCHTHKYDPIHIDEYYSFYAFFNQTEDADRFDDQPLVAMPPPQLAAEIERHNAPLNTKIAELNSQLVAPDEAIDAAQAQWEQQLANDKGKTPQHILKLIEIPAEQRTQQQLQQIRNHYRTVAPQLADLRKQIEEVRKQLMSPPMVPVMRELPAEKRRVTRVHTRGDFLSPGDPVEAGVPAAFHPWPAEAPRNRLGVAAWLVSRDNPLTARVGVNRHWAQFFGQGLVETEEDFGTQGTPPSHPELLDWLAVRFMDDGWSFKKLCKTIVMSATYQQASIVTPVKRERDPRNVLLSRGPRFRLEAEMVRDNALAVAGLLSRKIGGPSVMPWQPEGLWAAVYSGDNWITSPGEDRHRRGLYTFMRRTSPYPSMLAFDGTSREVCAVRRIRTNTPLQALVTLNDPVYVEAAQAMARRIIREGGQSPQERITYAVRLALSRRPSPEEVHGLHGLYERRLAFFRDRSSEAELFATEPLGPLQAGSDAAELAAYTAVCNVILNLDEVLTKG